MVKLPTSVSGAQRVDGLTGALTFITNERVFVQAHRVEGHSKRLGAHPFPPHRRADLLRKAAGQDMAMFAEDGETPKSNGL